MRRSHMLLLAAVVLAACDSEPTTGSLVVNVTGLPTGVQASVRVSGPNQFFQLVGATTTLENLAPGAYAVIRDTVSMPDNCFGVPVVRDTVIITSGQDIATTAAYQGACGSIVLSVLGLPETVASRVRVQGPMPVSSYNQIHSAGQTIAGLRPGVYEITADTLTSFLGDRFGAAPFMQSVTVTAAAPAVPAPVIYALMSGSLTLNVTGLPASNTIQGITVTGPNGFLQRAAQSVTMRGLAAGTYNVAAANITGTCPNTYSAVDQNLSATVAVGATSGVSVAYTATSVSPADLNLKIDKLYLTQAAQNPDGTVPIITGKPALVRIFGSANQCNTMKPKVRVTTSTGFTTTIAAAEDSVRVLPDEGKLSATWNAVIDQSFIQPGMTVFAEIDADAEVTEANEGDNRFPASGGKALDVRPGPVVGLRFVPIHQTQLNLTGEVNVNLLLDWPRKLHPVADYSVDIRSTPFTVAGPIRACNDAATGRTTNGGCPSWTDVLAQLDAAREAEGSKRYYYGVVKVNYPGGVAGYGYAPGKTAMGWDYTHPNTNLNSASQVMAHELGHNFNRLHAPCGLPANAPYDTQYPTTGLHANGRIGVYGWDPTEGLKAPTTFTDVMSYCDSPWISDYTYVAMLNWISDPLRGPTLPSVGSAASAEQPSLLVSGKIEHGAIVLEPAFEISARPDPIAPGPYRLSATDDAGAELFSIPFSAQQIADAPDAPETFAFVVPLSSLRGRTLAELKLTARGRTVTSRATGHVSADPGVDVTRINSRLARIRWDATRFPVVMVRDPATGHVLSFARGGDATVVTSQAQLELNFSNRLRSSRRYREFK